MNHPFSSRDNADYLARIMELSCLEPEARPGADALDAIRDHEAYARALSFPLVKTLRELSLDDRQAWCLRLAVGRALAHTLGRADGRAFKPAELGWALNKHAGLPPDPFGGALHQGMPLVANGLLISEQHGQLGGWTGWQLGAGLDEWFMGGPLLACQAAHPKTVPTWLQELDCVQDAAAPLAEQLRGHGSPALVLLCHDADFAAAVACTAIHTEASPPSIWHCQYPEEAEEDVIPALVWSARIDGRPSILALEPGDSLLPFMDPSERAASAFTLDIEHHHAPWPLLLIQHTLDPDPLGLRQRFPVLDLEPLFIGRGSSAIRRVFDKVMRGELGQPMDGELPRCPSVRSVDLAMRSIGLHHRVYGDLGPKVLPDLVNREARLHAGRTALDQEPTSKGVEPVPETTLEDLIVAEPTRQVLDGVVERARAGGRCVLLLHGPPGTGKSFTARCLAGTLGRPIEEARASELRGKYYGQEEKWMRQLFERADSRPTVLVFDEADEWLGRREGSSATEGGGRIMECSEMLLNLERYRGLVVLTTNRAEILDPALSRRVDIWHAMEMPGPDERMALWSRAVGPHLTMGSCDLVLLATIPISGGDIEATVAQAEAGLGDIRVPGLMALARARAERSLLQG